MLTATECISVLSWNWGLSWSKKNEMKKMKHVSSEQWGLIRIALDARNKKHLVSYIFQASKLNAIPLFSQSSPFQMSTSSLWNRWAMKRLHNTDVLSAKPNDSKHAGERLIFTKHLQKSQYHKIARFKSHSHVHLSMGLMWSWFLWNRHLSFLQWFYSSGSAYLWRESLFLWLFITFD